jgi:hypothetical protein
MLHPRRLPWKVLMRAAFNYFNRQVPGLGYAVLLSRLEPRCGSGRMDRHVGYWRALHNYLSQAAPLAAGGKVACLHLAAA